MEGTTYRWPCTAIALLADQSRSPILLRPVLSVEQILQVESESESKSSAPKSSENVYHFPTPSRVRSPRPPHLQHPEDGATPRRMSIRG